MTLLSRSVTACAFAIAAAPFAQDARLPRADAGTVAPFVFHATPANIREARATAADVKAGEASARKLASLVAEVPSLNPPVGFSATFVGVLMAPDPTQARVRPVAPLDLWVRFGAPVSRGDEVNFLHFYVNDLRPVILDHIGARKWEDARGDFYVEPPQTGQIAGFPMFNDLLVIARPGDSIWAPVPVERLARSLAAEFKNGADAAEKRRSQARADLEAFLSAAEQQKRRADVDAARQRSDAASEVRRLETFFAEDEAAIRSKIDPDPSKPADVQWYFGPVNAYKELQAILASPDAAGRAAPACVSGGETGDRWRMKIVPVGSPGCRRVVEANLALFKPTLPRSAIQLITVENIEWCRKEVAGSARKTAGDCTANLEVVRQLDWQRVAALLEK